MTAARSLKIRSGKTGPRKPNDCMLVSVSTEWRAFRGIAEDLIDWALGWREF